MQKPARRGELEQWFPEPVFALAAPASVPCFPDTELLGGIARCLKPGLAARLVSGGGHGSSKGLGGVLHASTLHSCPSASRAGLSHCSPAQALRLLNEPGLGKQCHLLHHISLLVFHPAKPGRIPSQPQGQHSLSYKTILLTAQRAAMGCAAPTAAWPGQLGLSWG